MPQLDHLTYFSQYFWLCVTFFTFYAFCVKYYLPELTRLAKYRGKRLNEGLSTEGSSANDQMKKSIEGLKGSFGDVHKSSQETSGFFTITSGSWFWSREWKPFGKTQKGRHSSYNHCEESFQNHHAKESLNESLTSGHTGGFDSLMPSSTKGVYLDAFDVFVFKGLGLKMNK